MSSSPSDSPSGQAGWGLITFVAVCLAVICSVCHAQEGGTNKAGWSQTMILAEAHFAKGQLAEAEELFGQALASIDAKLSDASTSQSPASSEMKRAQRRCLFVLPQIYRLMGQRADALRLALRYRAELRGNDVLDLMVENELNIAEDSVATGDHLAARALLRELLDNRLGPLKAMPKLKCLAILATLEELAGQRPKALELWASARQEAVKLLENSRLLGPNDQLYCLGQLAQFHEVSGETERANKVVAAMLKLRGQLGSKANGLTPLLQQLATNALLREAAERAEYYLRLVLESQQKNGDRSAEALTLPLLANALKRQGQRDAARTVWQKSAKLQEELLSELATSAPGSPRRVTHLKSLRTVYQELGLMTEAIRVARQLYDIRERELGREHLLTIEAHSSWGTLLANAGDFEEALPIMTQLVSYWREQGGAAELPLARACNNLGAVQQGAGNITDAAESFREALALRERRLPADHPDLIVSYNNLASVLLSQSRYSEAVQLFRRALERSRELGDRATGLRATTLLNLASAYKAQGSYDQAIKYCLEALELHESILGRDSVGAGVYLNALASLSRATGDFAASRQSALRAIELFKAHRQETSKAAALAYANVGMLDYLARDWLPAQKSLTQAAVIHETHGDWPYLARTQNTLGLLAYELGQIDEAESLFQQVLDLRLRAQLRPQDAYSALCNLALVLRQRDQASPKPAHRARCRALLEEAVDTIEASRGWTTDSEFERAEFFGRFASAFELLVEWSFEDGDLEAAFLAAERSRNRTFLDQMNLAGIDLRETLTNHDGAGSGSENAAILKREQELRRQLNSLRTRAVSLNGSENPAAVLKELSQQHAELQQSYRLVWKSIQERSPFYRELLTRETELASLKQMQQRGVRPKQLVLMYTLGPQKSFLTLIGDQNFAARFVRLQLSAETAEQVSGLVSEAQRLASRIERADRGTVGTIKTEKGALQTTSPNPIRSLVPAGDLTRETTGLLVRSYLSLLRQPRFDVSRGVIGTAQSEKGKEVSQGVSGQTLTGRLAALTEILLPTEIRKLIEQQAPESIVIIPDGALQNLPFEALLLREGPRGGTPQFVLDRFPPICYAPSANVLLKIIERPSVTSAAKTKVLTVGNPVYSKRAASDSKSSAPEPDVASDNMRLPDAAVAQTFRNAFLGLGQELPALPGTKEECANVAKHFQAAHFDVVQLLDADASEKQVLNHLTGRSVIHIAAHGLVDEQQDNLFGAIALSRPPEVREDEDGFLSYSEILRLPLRDCELAVLSACQTNVGAEVKMEAGSSLARAFIAAGARRVVASHWSVADHSTARLIAELAREIAEVSSRGDSLNYAQALHRAKLTVRRESGWESPYYWAPFVLIGPPQR